MAIRFYDEAIVNKINKWIKDSNVRILRPDETSRLFQMYADKNNDNPIKLPLIAISRDREVEILNANKQLKTFSGVSIIKNERINVPMNVIPIHIGYQIDIYTRFMEEADEYVRNFVFNFVNFPKLKVTLPYNDINVEHISNLWLDSNIVDNSDIREHLFADQFVRFTLKIEVDDAYLFSLPIKDNFILSEVDYEVLDSETTEIIEDGVVIKN